MSASIIILLVNMFVYTFLGIIWSSKTVLNLFIKMVLLTLAVIQGLYLFGIIQ